MKQLLFLSVLALMISSCSLDDDNNYNDYYYEFIPIENAEVPESFQLGETYTITVEYFRPTTCHYFSEFYFEKSENERTIAVVNWVEVRDNCQNLENDLEEKPFNFIVTQTGTYIFKFWQGVDENDVDQYLTYEIPVTE